MAGGPLPPGSSTAVQQYLMSQGIPAQTAWAMVQQAAMQQAYGGGGGYGGFGGLNPYSLMTLLGGLQEQNILSKPWNMQMDAAKIAMNPGAMQARIGQFERPLSQGLINSVTRATMPRVNMSGMGTSPGLSQQFVAEALAPYQMQEESMARDMALSTLNVPFEIGSGAAGGYPSTWTTLPYMMSLQNNPWMQAMNAYGGGYRGGYGYNPYGP